MLEVHVSIEMDEAKGHLVFLHKKLPAIMLRAAKASTALMVRRVVRGRLNEPKGAKGSVYPNLRRQTGTLQRNVTASRFHQVDSADKVVAAIGTSLVYGIAHEEGFTGVVQVKAHTRRLVEQARSKAAVRRVKKKLKAGKKRVAHVKAHKRKMNLLARYYLRDTVLTHKKDIKGIARKAVIIAAKTGKLPQVTELAPAS